MPQGKVILGDIESKEYRNLNNIKDAKKIDVTKDTKGKVLLTNGNGN